MQVAGVLTPATPSTVAGAFVTAYRNVVGRDPVSRASWLMPLAQSGFETAHWTKMRGWNTGFLTAAGSQDYYILGPGNQLHFANYASLLDGATAMMSWLAKHGALVHADANDLPGYLAALQAGGYLGYGSSEYQAYGNGIAAIMSQYANLQPTFSLAPSSTLSVPRAIVFGAAVVGASWLTAKWLERSGPRRRRTVYA